jgi:putative DNA primase/helicase
MSDIYDKARSACSRLLIESLAPGGTWKDDGDYWPVSPIRADSKPGSFHISPEGTWFDFATDEGGDIIKLVELISGISPKAAATWIIEQSGQSVPTEPKKKKSAPVFPIPDSAKEELNRTIQSDYATKNHGKVKTGWRYHDAQGGWVFAVVRFDRADGSKDVIPYFFGDDGKWHEGQAYKDNRPLYNLPALLANSSLPVLVVEGEKCASVKVPGYIVTTWSGGSSAVNKTDWAPLAGRVVTIWPDADSPGLKAAQAVKAILSQAEILDIQGQAEGWDIADCADPYTFLLSCPVLQDTDLTPAGEPDPFRCIGYDSVNYWFLLGNQRQPYAIQKGGFTGSKLGELAPPSWWAEHDCLGDKGAIDVTCGQRLVIDRQNAAGMFDADILRGAGVWIDNDKILINDGQRIVTLEGQTHDLAAHTGQGVYVRSSVRFGDMTGPESTDMEGRALLQLMEAQLWARPIDSVAALGWSLIAPFGGLLKFRPHIWISGRKGSGKTYVLDNIIREIVGPFGHEGSGKDTEPGIRRTLNMDARPVSLDEMEPKGKARENVTKILDLARNASSDGSGRVTMADGKGTVSFLIRSCFCFASVNTIASEGAAIASRIIACELEAPKTPAEERAKIAESKRYYTIANMANAARFRRRMFRAMPRVLSDIALLRELLPEHFGGTREADLWAPILAAAWAIQSSQSVGCKDGQDWLDSVLGIEAATRQKLMEDEDKVIEHILSATIESDDRKKKSVAEWMLLAATLDDGYAHAGDLLGRYGMKIMSTREGMRVLAVATSSDALSRLLKDTPYESSYDAQIRRNALCLNPTNASNQRFAGMQKLARLLDWHAFKETYMGDAS